MRAMNRTVLALLVGVALAIPVALIGEALGFGSLAWIAAVMAIVVVVSLIDREGFYGTPTRP